MPPGRCGPFPFSSSSVGSWEREEGVANRVSTKELVDRLVKTGVVTGYRSHDRGALLGSLTRMQRVRNLTDPPLLEFHVQTEAYWINLPRYEPLLQGYREWYRQRHPEDYRKLFPDGEPHRDAH